MSDERAPAPATRHTVDAVQARYFAAYDVVLAQ